MLRKPIIVGYEVVVNESLVINVGMYETGNGYCKIFDDHEGRRFVTMPVAPTTAEQRLARKNELKARGNLLMDFPDKHQLKFNSHKDDKTLIEAIEKRFGGNTGTKKVQKTLLKQQYENFTGSSSESLDQIHDRLQKLISQLEILGVSLSQDDINLKFLRSLPFEWKTHSLIWRNKTDLEDQSLDDLFNSLKIYEAEVKNSSSAGTTTQNIAFVSSSNTDSTTESVSAAASVSAVNAKLHPIDADDLEEMDLKWKMAMFTMRARRFLQRTRKNLGANGPTYLGFDMSKVECYNCHKKGHFTRECRSPKDSKRNGDAEPQRRNVPVETSTSNALVSQCDGVGSYDWSFQAEEEPANYALIAFSSSSSSSDNEVVSCSKACTKAYAQLQSHYDKLTADFRKSHDGYRDVPPPYTRTFMPPKPDLVFNNAPNGVETDHSAFNVKLSPTKPDQDLSLTNRSLAPIIEDWVSDSEDESETKTPQNVPTATTKPASPKPTSNGKRRNRKACFVCKSLTHLIKDCDYHEKKMAQLTARNHAHMRNHKQYAPMTHQNPQKHMVPAAVLTQSKPVPITVVRPVSTAMPKIKVTRSRHAKPIVSKSNSPTRRHINYSPSSMASNSPPRVTTIKAPMVNAAKGMQGKWEWKPKCLILDHGNPQHALKDKAVIDSGCSRHMKGNMYYLSDFEDLNGGYVAFGGNPKGGKISRKGKIKTGKLDFDDVYFVKELKFYLFSVSQMCDKKNSVLFTDIECLVLSPDFKLSDESQVLLRVPRENNMYNVNLKNIIPSGDLTCFFAKATINESNLWHRRPSHINFKTMNKLVKGNLVRGLPTKVFENDNTCVACKKGKQHRASCKTMSVSSVDQPLYRLHMDLFRPTFVKSLNKKSYCLVVIDDYSRFTWVFFLTTKDETSFILKTFITCLENQLSLKVKVTKSDNGTEFKNNDLNQFCGIKGIKREFSAEAVNTACYIQNRVLVTKPHNKTPYELLHGEEIDQQYVLFLAWYSSFTNPQNTDEDDAFDAKKPEFEFIVSPSSKFEDFFDNSMNEVNAAGTLVSTIGQNSLNITNTYSAVGPSNAASPTHGKSSCIDASQLPDDPDMPELEDITYSDDEDDVGAEADFNNLETSITVSPIPTTRVHKDHPVTQIIGDLSSATETKSMIRVAKDQEPKRVHQAIKDPSQIEAMQEELIQFKMQKVWVLVDLPYGKRAIGHTLEERIDYEEVFAPVARIEAIRLFLAYSSFMGFIVYQMDVKSAFLYGTIEEEVYVCQPLRFEDPDYPNKVYKVVKALYGLHQAPRA
nr:hypothetical protein [Tanacetum cinerariifolium]